MNGEGIIETSGWGGRVGGNERSGWDPKFIEQVGKWVRPAVRTWFRAEVRGIERIPAGGPVLLVANHSGGMITPDGLVFAPAFYGHFGYDRPLHSLAHYGVVMGPLSLVMNRLGIIEASPDNAAAALDDGAVVLVFPGGDYDAYRPTTAANVIDFNGRTGYVKTAIRAGVPIVPLVSIGAQETQLFLTRGHRLAKLLRLTKFRLEIVPVSVGLPFGLSVFFPPNLPLPSKIVMEVLDPIDIVAQFGDDPDIDEVDAHVRVTMQRSLDRLAARRRFPVLG
ncbi:glycerol acyltransferase [Mycolicibacterium chitae]|uniref:Phospholipid/glycerol acyltransferase n=1 Tax=Mycolicibacterium chitae TaxID=1792 RepID=A0A3S4RMU2_MYCCI|nr:lysophospholipid acyltransferase family protein [Mycolicibacterium chitae]MCV7106667.1 acyltransferase family protein [Mycolicibacterium chitae]BBZ04462.1 glycerol acyltransferase [Mycolicibacterium chitae]VEG48096.1 phospholipid/glycerol acyltransferase [Mycolicibacterium chitae]